MATFTWPGMLVDGVPGAGGPDVPDVPDAWRNTPPAPASGDDGAGRVLELPKSKALARLRYHAPERTLTVEFRSGAVYRYFGVPEEDFDKLAAAPSPGARFNQDIQPYHEWERVA